MPIRSLAILVAVIITAIVVVVLRKKHGSIPPQYFAYFVATVLLITMFSLPGPQNTWAAPEDLGSMADLIRTQARAIERLTLGLQAILFFVAMLLAAGKTRIAQYFEKLAGSLSESGGESDKSEQR